MDKLINAEVDLIKISLYSRPKGDHRTNALKKLLIKSRLELSKELQPFLNDFCKESLDEIHQELDDRSFNLLSVNSQLLATIIGHGHIKVPDTIIKKVKNSTLKDPPYYDMNFPTKNFRLIINAFDITFTDVIDQKHVELLLNSSGINLLVKYFMEFSMLGYRFPEDLIVRIYETLEDNYESLPKTCRYFIETLLTQCGSNEQLIKNLLDNDQSLLYKLDITNIERDFQSDFIIRVMTSNILSEHCKNKFLLSIEGDLKVNYDNMNFLYRYRQLDDSSHVIRNQIWTTLINNPNPSYSIGGFLSNFVFQIPGITQENIVNDKGRELYFKMLNLYANKVSYSFDKLYPHLVKMIDTSDVYKDTDKYIENIVCNKFFNSPQIINHRSKTNMMLRFIFYLSKTRSNDNKFAQKVQSYFENVDPKYYTQNMYLLYNFFDRHNLLLHKHCQKLIENFLPLTPHHAVIFLDLVTKKFFVDQYTDKIISALRLITENMSSISSSLNILLHEIAFWAEYVSVGAIRNSKEAKVFIHKVNTHCKIEESKLKSKNQLTSSVLFYMAAKHQLQYFKYVSPSQKVAIGCFDGRDCFISNDNVKTDYHELKNELGDNMIFLPEELTNDQKDRLDKFMRINSYLRSSIQL